MMHKQILRTALAVAVTGLGAAAAHAQSSVTLYGIVDAGFTYTNNQKGQSAYQATPGNVQGSRWGLTGSEDLGGGNKVLFKLENSFNLETGALGGGGRMFGRGAWVGLSNDQAGMITLGRQYNSVQDYLSNLQINGVGAMSQYGNADPRRLYRQRDVRVFEHGRPVRQQPRVERRRRLRERPAASRRGVFAGR